MLKKKLTREERRRLQKKRRRKRIAVLVIEIVLLAMLSMAAYAMFVLDKMDFTILNEEKLEVYRDTGPYTNIALFGLDSREGEIDGGVQSDCIMIASINNETDDVKIMSVYRDTLLQQSDGSYEKANSAYNTGGPEGAISMLNRNFDLDIKNYVSVNFKALVDTIDILGGIEVDLTVEEAFWCNGYAFETAQVVGQEMIPIKEEAGVQLLDGVHAVGYTRIRYTEGDDFKRAERQRFILNEVLKKAKQADFGTLKEIVDKVMPQVSTSFISGEIMGFAANALNYNIVETTGFPYRVVTCDNVMNHTGSYVVTVGHASNVKELHGSLFGELDYEPSETVQLINDEIIYLTGVTEDEASLNTQFDRDMSAENNAAEETTEEE